MDTMQVKVIPTGDMAQLVQFLKAGAFTYGVVIVDGKFLEYSIEHLVPYDHEDIREDALALVKSVKWINKDESLEDKLAPVSESWVRVASEQALKSEIARMQDYIQRYKDLRGEQ